jgi:hypothetical protein
LERLRELGIHLDVDVDSTMVEIERNIQWSAVKVQEIAAWVESERSAATKMNFSYIANVLLLSFLMIIVS